jgi:hypothetical protein
MTERAPDRAGISPEILRQPASRDGSPAPGMAPAGLVRQWKGTVQGALAAQQPRAWVIELPAGEPILTANHHMNRYAANRRVQDLKGLMIRLAQVHKLPRLEAATVTVEYRSPPRRKADRHPLASDRVEDHDALYPTRKALVDGLVKAGVLADDNRKRVTNSGCRILPETHPMGLLRVVITEVAAGGEQG